MNNIKELLALSIIISAQYHNKVRYLIEQGISISDIATKLRITEKLKAKINE